MDLKYAYDTPPFWKQRKKTSLSLNPDLVSLARKRLKADGLGDLSISDLVTLLLLEYSE